MSMYKKIVGHEDIINQLQTAVSVDRISHAYILQAEDGTGKKLIAQAFAEALLCEKGGVEGCGECHFCKQTASLSNPDLKWVSHEKPASIGVDDVRIQIVEDVMIKPYNGKYKVYIVDEAEKLTQQAQNALLKTIEEPPAYSVILFLTNNSDIFLPTILSRCTILKLRPLQTSVIEQYLVENYDVPDYEAGVCAAFSQGRLGKAIEFAKSEDFKNLKEEAVNMAKNVSSYDVADILNEVHKITGYKLQINDYIDILEIWFRDVLLFKATKDPNSLIFKEEVNAIRKQASKSSYEGVENILDALEKAKTRLKANVNFDLAIQLMLYNIKEN